MTYVREAFKAYDANSQDINRNDGLLTDIRYFIDFKKWLFVKKESFRSRNSNRTQRSNFYLS